MTPTPRLHPYVWSIALCLAACAAPGGDAKHVDVADLRICEAGYAPPQLRLLTRREYDHALRDLAGLSVDVPCTADTQCDLDVASCTNQVCTEDPCELHTFIFPWSDAGSIHVAGSFNDWSSTVAGGGWPMTFVPELGVWYTKRTLPPGEHQYKYVVDEQHWHLDSSNPWTAGDGFGGSNSVVSLTCDGSAPASAATPSDALPPESRPTGWHFDNHVQSGIVTASHVDAYLSAAGDVALQARAILDTLAPCDTTQDSCIDTFVSTWGARAFRRPLSPTDLERYTTLARTEDDPADGILLALEAMLSSPSFLYRSEVGEEVGDMRVLDGHEVATALSFFLWGTTPDATLLEAAAAGELADVSAVRSHAERMLDDPRARDHFGDFAVQWLGLEKVLTVDKNPALFPEFNGSVRAAALAETRMAFTHALFDGSGQLDDFLTSDTHFVNEALAPMYGLNDISGVEMRPVKIEDRGNSGVLGHVSMLAATAYSDQTSPVRRGLFVREHLLCQGMGVPPADAGGIPEVDPNGTTRERFAQHSADPGCAGCHQFIDPVGFGFEHYDPIGRWRDLDAGQPIDASGQVVDVDRDGGDDVVAFSTVAELADIVASSHAVQHCFTEELYQFATGWETPKDDCALQDLTDAFVASDGNIRQLIVDIATSPTFLTRRVESQP